MTDLVLGLFFECVRIAPVAVRNKIVLAELVIGPGFEMMKAY